MDANGNLSITERRALKRGDLVIYQTEGTAHRGEQRGRVNYVGESGIVWIGTTGSRYALACDYVRRADWAPGAAPEAARRVDDGGTGKDTYETPDAPDGQETAPVDALRAQVDRLKGPGGENTYRIKPLRWEYLANRNLEAWEALAIGGKYRVERWRRDNGRWRKWAWAFEDMTEGAPDVRRCRTAEECKALAEAHWRETITRFLEEVTHE